MTAYGSAAMDLLHHEGDGVGRGFGDDAVAEVEDVPRAAARAIEHLAHLATQGLARREQGGGIEVPLDPLTVAQPTPGGVQGDAPVDADDVSTRPREVLEEGACPCAEVDDRDVRRGGERRRFADGGQ